MDMNTIKGRFRTFQKTPWPHQEDDDYYAGEKDLAHAGLYSYSSPEAPDRVRCFYCEKNIHGWAKDDIPWVEHKKLSPGCLLANLDNLSNRIALFEIGEWEKRGKKKASIKEFAEAGFFFYPSDEDDDTLMCFHCGVSLDQWEYDDDPLEEHKKRNNRCPYLVLQRVYGRTAFDLFLARDTIYNAKRKLGLSEEATLKAENTKASPSINKSVGGYLTNIFGKMRGNLEKVVTKSEKSNNKE